MKLIELTDRAEVAKLYDVYKHCMYMPTQEKFNKKVETFFKDDSIKIFACLYNDEFKGVVVASFTEDNKAEIVGISVDESVRNKGIGSFMIKGISADSLYAETDDDAVGFYRKNGFAVTKFLENYDGETVARYKCELPLCGSKTTL